MAVEVRGHGDGRVPKHLLDVVQVSARVGPKQSGSGVPKVMDPLVPEPSRLGQRGELAVQVARFNPATRGGLAGRNYDGSRILFGPTPGKAVYYNASRRPRSGDRTLPLSPIMSRVRIEAVTGLHGPLGGRGTKSPSRTTVVQRPTKAQKQGAAQLLGVE